MNILIVLSVITILAVYCQLSWHSLSLSLDVVLQRTAQLQQANALTSLMQYGQFLLAASQPKTVTGSVSSEPRLLYAGPWPLAPVQPKYQAKLTLVPALSVKAGAKLGPKNKVPYLLQAQLWNQQGQLVAQQVDRIPLDFALPGATLPDFARGYVGHGGASGLKYVR